MIEGLLAWGKLDQNIHVAIPTRFVPLHGAKKRQALHPQP
jgi:hypothetical protein